MVIYVAVRVIAFVTLCSSIALLSITLDEFRKAWHDYYREDASRGKLARLGRAIFLSATVLVVVVTIFFYAAVLYNPQIPLQQEQP